jgi:hypothetical protein
VFGALFLALEQGGRLSHPCRTGTQRDGQTSGHLSQLAGIDPVEANPGSTARRPSEVTLVDVDVICPQPRMLALLPSVDEEGSGSKELQILSRQRGSLVKRAQRLVDLVPAEVSGGLAGALQWAALSDTADLALGSPKPGAGCHNPTLRAIVGSVITVVDSGRAARAP